VLHVSDVVRLSGGEPCPLGSHESWCHVCFPFGCSPDLVAPRDGGENRHGVFCFGHAAHAFRTWGVFISPCGVSLSFMGYFRSAAFAPVMCRVITSRCDRWSHLVLFCGDSSFGGRYRSNEGAVPALVNWQGK